MTFPNSRSTEYIRIGRATKLPENVSHLSSMPNEDMPTVDADLLWHPQTDHLRIGTFQPAGYYADYFMTTSYSESMQALQEQQARLLAKIAREAFPSSESLSLCEIGCGDGSFLDHAATTFGSVLGIEPSAPFAAAARNRGHQVLNTYIASGAPPTDERFNAFASRQVFEHLDEPLEVLLAIRELLLPGAVGLIEVPNGRRAVTQGRFFEVFPDHVNYFSRQSLSSLAVTAGFSVVACHETFGGDYLELWLKAPERLPPSLDQWDRVLQTTRESLDRWASRTPSRAHKAFFGCGAKALAIASQDPHAFRRHFKFGIDSDPNKHHRFVPNTDVEVLAIADDRLAAVQTVMILALSYREEIASVIRASLPSVSSVASLGEKGELIDI